MSRGLLLALLGGIASAVFPVLLAPAPLVAVGLYLGSAFAGVSAGLAALIVLLNLGSNNAIIHIVAICVPALLIVHQALISRPGEAPNSLTWYPPGQIIVSLAIYGVLVLGCLAAVLATTGNTLGTAAHNVIQNATAMITDSGNFKYQTANDQKMAKRMFDVYASMAAPTFSGLAFTFLYLNVLGVAAGTQAMLKRANIALRPSPSYIGMVLPRWLAGLLAAALALSWLPGAIGSFGLNALVFLSTPFFLLGLTVIHTLSRRSLKPGSVLSAFYFGLFLVGVLIGLAIPIMALMVLLGIGEQWLSLRQRLTKPSANQEDE